MTLIALMNNDCSNQVQYPTAVTIPLEYGPWFESLGFSEISFGCGSLELFGPDELEDRQVGYSRSSDGQSFCDGAPGSWKPEWIAIGCDTALGDPILVDTSGPGSPVMTAMHGEGSWDPHIIALSLKDFAVALRALKEISVGREYPVALEQNPLSPDEKDRALRLIGADKHKEIDMDFWDAMLEG